MRQPLVIGNWKMHGSRESVTKLLTALVSSGVGGAVEVAVCPAYVHLGQAVGQCASASIAVGAQDCSHLNDGCAHG